MTKTYKFVSFVTDHVTRWPGDMVRNCEESVREGYVIEEWKVTEVSPDRRHTYVVLSKPIAPPKVEPAASENTGRTIRIT